MDSYTSWEKYGTFLSLNFVVVTVIVMLVVRGAWGLSGAAIGILIVADAIALNRIRRKSETPGHVHAGRRGRFFLFYGYVLAVGALIRLVQSIRAGIQWLDFVVFLILVLLAVATLSIAKKMRRG
jgi:hypothetical protein